jgi:hypothetical protein
MPPLILEFFDESNGAEKSAKSRRFKGGRKPCKVAGNSTIGGGRLWRATAPQRVHRFERAWGQMKAEISGYHLV